MISPLEVSMRATGIFVLALIALGLIAAPSSADVPDGWHKSLKDGVEASAKSGKPILLITSWSRGL